MSFFATAVFLALTAPTLLEAAPGKISPLTDLPGKLKALKQRTLAMTTLTSEWSDERVNNVTEGILDLASEALSGTLPDDRKNVLRSLFDEYCKYLGQEALYEEHLGLTRLENDTLNVEDGNGALSHEKTAAFLTMTHIYDDSLSNLYQDIQKAYSNDEARNRLIQMTQHNSFYQDIFDISVDYRILAFSDCGPCKASKDELARIIGDNKINAGTTKDNFLCPGQKAWSITHPAKTADP